MNEHKKPRGHRAHNDKDSILADAKNLLYILYPAIQRMPKIERIEGAPVENTFRQRLNDKYHLKLKRI